VNALSKKLSKGGLIEERLLKEIYTGRSMTSQLVKHSLLPYFALMKSGHHVTRTRCVAYFSMQLGTICTVHPGLHSHGVFFRGFFRKKLVRSQPLCIISLLNQLRFSAAEPGPGN
jgi:hypothetical protein